MSYATALDLATAHCPPRMFSPEANDSAPDDPLNWDPATHPNRYTSVDSAKRAAVVSAGIAHSTKAAFHTAAALAAERQDIKARLPYRKHQEAFTKFAWESGGLRYDRAMQYVRVSDAIPEAFWDEFSGFEWTTILAVEKHTRLLQDTPGDRRARIIRVLTEAKARNFGSVGTLELVAETLEQDRLERFGPASDPHLPAAIGRDSAAGIPGPAEAPPERARQPVNATVDGFPVAGEVDQTHAFMDERRQPDLPAPDDGLRALVLSLQQQLDAVRAQMEAFGQPADPEDLIEFVFPSAEPERLSRQLNEDAGVKWDTAARILAEERSLRKRRLTDYLGRRELLLVRKAGA